MRVIRTERLSLRRVTEADLDLVLAVQGDPETTRFRPSGPADAAECERNLLTWLAHWDEHDFGYWVVEHNGAAVGLGGLQHSEFTGVRYLNLYYRFRPSAWGKGFAPEMGRAAVDWAAEHAPHLPVWIVTTVDNEPARRVADKLGFREFDQADYRGALSRFYTSAS
ncbi:RimJ/RimL family protein N-acetyltransferase [Actinokineospora baliensis]|uniref:GNAT family N-acetyltransferase n=1 Tax=Actinokineospora baliensis TaxID=547056 RepID=UPI00195B26AB|nr:GNAT family N-acetyltransferase [Actinokineospora baliensis]MBM7772663.1 RimJ/RimL family protein N-acetyltransferase [Actinokineospora baliensis]